MRLLEIKALRVVELIVRTERYRTKDPAGGDNHGEACAIIALEGISAATTTYIRSVRLNMSKGGQESDFLAGGGTEGGAGAAGAATVGSPAAPTVSATVVGVPTGTTTASNQISSAALVSGKTDTGNGAPCLVELVLNMLDSVQTAE